jgi:hypothetical protein
MKNSIIWPAVVLIICICVNSCFKQIGVEEKLEYDRVYFESFGKHPNLDFVGEWSGTSAQNLVFGFFFILGSIAYAIGLSIDNDNKKEQLEKEKKEIELKIKKQKELETKNQLIKLEEESKNYKNDQLEKIHTFRNSLISKFDKLKKNEIHLIPCNDFGILLKKHQSKIVEFDKTYIQKFVKISNFLSLKKKNIAELYNQLFILERIKAEDIPEKHWIMRAPYKSHFHKLNDIDELIQIEIHTYESVIFHSISMITALLKKDLLTFYEIFESFDKLGIFNSNWENDISAKLSNIDDKLDTLIDSIKQLEYRIENSLDSLSYTTETSFKELNKSVTGQLSEIGSSLKFNNLLTGIQVYQTHSKHPTNTMLLI